MTRASPAPATAGYQSPVPPEPTASTMNTAGTSSPSTAVAWKVVAIAPPTSQPPAAAGSDPARRRTRNEVEGGGLVAQRDDPGRAPGCLAQPARAEQQQQHAQPETQGRQRQVTQRGAESCDQHQQHGEPRGQASGQGGLERRSPAARGGDRQDHGQRLDALDQGAPHRTPSSSRRRARRRHRRGQRVRAHARMACGLTTWRTKPAQTRTKAASPSHAAVPA